MVVGNGVLFMVVNYDVNIHCTYAIFTWRLILTSTNHLIYNAYIINNHNITLS